MTLRIFTFLSLSCYSLAVLSQDPKEIIRKAEENFRGVKSSKSEMTIEIIRPKWSREMKMKSWAKGEELSLILITSPAKEKGKAFLKRKKEVWSWMPSIERTIKMPPSMMMQSWMGTDFTNDDLVRESSQVNDYTHKLLGESTINGRKCYKIQMIPKPEAPVVWGKIIAHIDKQDYVQLKAQMYDEDGYLVNTMNSSQVKTMGNRKVATKMELIPEDKKGQKTIMTMNSIEYDIPLNDNFFTTQNMRKVK